MRARKVNAAGVVVLVAAGCSNPAADPASIDDSLLAELVPAISPAGQPGEMVLSPLELTRSREPGEAPRAASAPRTDARVATEAAPAERLGEPVSAAADEPMAAEVEPVIAIAAMDDAGADETGSAGVDGPEANPGPRPRIIIRGGVSVYDDCKKHLPGIRGLAGTLGTVGVMINDRTPPVIGRGAERYPPDVRAPTTRAGGFRGNGGSPTFGGHGGFAGGIR